MLKIFLSKDFYYLQSLGFNFEEHKHIAPQISLAEPGCSVSWQEQKGAALFFPPEVKHCVKSEHMFHTFLVNPVHPKTRKFKGDSKTCRLFEPPADVLKTLTEFSFLSQDEKLLESSLETLLTQLTGDVADPLDERIAEVVQYIEDLDQKRVAAGELAEQIALSESRFLHLFKEELHTTVRKYLLWKRTMDGARLVVEGRSITDAAHAAGFTDSAHLARVFKSMFGSTLSSAFGREPAPILVIGEGSQSA